MSKSQNNLSQVVTPFFPQMQVLHLSLKDSPTLQCLLYLLRFRINIFLGPALGYLPFPIFAPHPCTEFSTNLPPRSTNRFTQTDAYVAILFPELSHCHEMACPLPWIARPVEIQIAGYWRFCGQVVLCIMDWSSPNNPI